MQKRTNVLFRFVLIALFLFAYQTTTIHTQHHHIAELGKCQVCDVSKTLGKAEHKTIFLEAAQSIAVEIEEIHTKQIVKDAFDLTQKPLPLRIDFRGWRLCETKTIPLGYFATAPPTPFS